MYTSNDAVSCDIGWRQPCVNSGQIYLDACQNALGNVFMIVW